MATTVPREADWDQAPGLLDGASTLTLTTDDCGLAYWLSAVAQGTLAGRAETGHAPGAPTPEYMCRPGPLRDSLLIELGCRSVAEEQATRVLSYYVTHAPGIPELEFYATQLIDEARHSLVFRNHLVELGVPRERLAAAVEEVSADFTAAVIDPIIDFTLATVRDEGDFFGGVAIFAIIIEGVLAPAAELSERKWSRLDPAAGEIARGTSIDEIRHLTVASSIVRDRLAVDPEFRPRLLDILRRGRLLWDTVPDRAFVMHREELFQAGLAEHADLLADYEIWPGRRLLDTTPAERYETAERWTDEMARARMAYMGLDPAIIIGHQAGAR
ncbi:VlmB-like protein [Parafrankia colletiae]|uniref:VlmB-like protein n=1 Tax=Parafrankia colletiae TaxID=573497 RepID=A0A1S1QEC2_9ACTN|nr:VlmB-like protein [Parafrankia colletiae]MCK9902327.1 VlmB-like protein [Frankia sp. Cpl3]OHV33143.1 VlmB-like protein [Parafrankia colletiae]